MTLPLNKLGGRLGSDKNTLSLIRGVFLDDLVHRNSSLNWSGNTSMPNFREETLRDRRIFQRNSAPITKRTENAGKFKRIISHAENVMNWNNPGSFTIVVFVC